MPMCHQNLKKRLQHKQERLRQIKLLNNSWIKEINLKNLGNKYKYIHTYVILGEIEYSIEV